VEIGAESRNKTIAAIVLMVLALALVAVRFFPSDSSASSTTTRPAATPAAPAPAPRAARTRPGGRNVSAAPRSLDPTLRYDWLKASEDTKYEGTGRNVFRAEAEPPPKPIAPAVTDKTAQDNTPPQPPPPPPINLKFFGFASKPGETKKVFLSQGEDIFIAAEGDIIDRRYRILRISPMSVEVEDVLNNNRQSIPLTQG
jgi:hypothetical protein